MPTGYTADIAKGITFKQFTMTCARAFSALGLMRDERMDAEIPEQFAPNDKHSKNIASARAELARLEKISLEEAAKCADAAYAEAEQKRLGYLAENEVLRERYEAMREQARNWKPPTPDHQGLKDFMVEQITESIKFDCGGSYYATPTVRLDGTQWLAAQQARAMKDISYHEAEYEKEVARTNKRAEWVKQLRASLP